MELIQVIVFGITWVYFGGLWLLIHAFLCWVGGDKTEDASEACLTITQRPKGERLWILIIC